MSFEPRQERAIGNYLKTHPELRLTLQARHDVVTFIDRNTSDQVEVSTDQLLETYDEDRKEAAKERARMKRQEARGQR